MCLILQVGQLRKRGVNNSHAGLKLFPADILPISSCCTDMESKSKLCWLHRFQSERQHGWKQICNWASTALQLHQWTMGLTMLSAKKSVEIPPTGCACKRTHVHFARRPELTWNCGGSSPGAAVTPRINLRYIQRGINSQSYSHVAVASLSKQGFDWMSVHVCLFW